MIKESQKQQISEKLKQYAGLYDSQNKAAKSLKNVSTGTVSQVINGKWELIKDEMWRNIAAQIGWSEKQWKIVETRNFKMLTSILKDAQANSSAFGLIGSAGSGKTIALKHYSANNKRAYMLSCNEYWNRKYFLGELLTQIGRDHSGLTVADMMNEVVRLLKQQVNPIILMDEADKLSDQVLLFFITLYNQLEDHCAIALCATDHLEKRIRRGLKLNKKGYKEIYSRLGRKFIELPSVGSTDVKQVCIANGIESKTDIKEIFQDSEYDLRRVKRKIHAVKMINNASNAD